MGTLSGFRPPQFSEDDAWLPAWLQQCNSEWRDVESIEEHHITFKQRVEELLCLQKGISNGESLRGEGGCDIGQLFISGTESSPFSCTQSVDNVLQLHLRLSSDDNSEDTSLTTDSGEIEPNYPIFDQPLENLGISGQPDVNLSTFCNVGAVNCSQTVEVERYVDNELLKHDGNVNLSEAAADAVELCVGASEALVINEMIENDLLEKSSSASAILEASLQVKQARLEFWKNTYCDSVSVESDIDNLSDLDDVIMESAYKDAGVHFNEFPGNELSVSQVKDTLESEYDEDLEHNKSRNSNYEHRKERLIDNNIQSRKDLAAECGCDTQKKIICSPVCDMRTDVVFQNDFMGTVDAPKKLHHSVSAEKVNTPSAENNPDETNVRSSPIMSCRDNEKDYKIPNEVQEQFQSRWFGGWISNNEVKHASVKHSIAKPFVGETSFFSESADTAPDENSFVQNRDKEAIVSSQLSIPSEKFSNRAKEVLLSQDVQSSTASLVDPLCSFVPCSISEDICSARATNHEDPTPPRHLNIIEHKKDNVLLTSPLDNMPADNSDSRSKVSRQFTSLKNYSTLPSHTKFSEKDDHQQRSFFIKRIAELTFQETNHSNREETLKTGAELPVANKENNPRLSVVLNYRSQCNLQASVSSTHNFFEKNPIGTAAQPETSEKILSCENLPPELSQFTNTNQGAQKLPTLKRVRFSEKETDIPDNQKIRKAQPTLKPCSTRAAKRSTKSSVPTKSSVRLLDRYLKTNLDKEKKRLIFQNMEFLLTGFSPQKEKEIEGLIRKYGGIVLSQVPSINSNGKRSSRLKSQVLPVVLCLKKIQSFKFLYGCAVNAYVLRVNWLMDSIAAGFVLPQKRYMILSRKNSRLHDQVYTAVKYNPNRLVFKNLGVMLHGKTKHFANITTIIKHGGGQVFKTLQKLVQTLETGRISSGVVVTDEESGASRHLKHCALEQNIIMTSVYWIIKCLYAGHLIPLEKKNSSRSAPVIKLQDSLELSQEI